MAWCRSCRSVINWYRTPSGKNMPIDPEPHPDGNVWIDVVNNVAVVVGRGTRDVLYQSHFSTCPAAAEHRRR